MKNRMTKGKGLGITILAVALAALLLVTACAPGPAAIEKTVEVGFICGLTGPAAASVQLMLQGLEDYNRYFNEQEDIPGVRIKALWGDSSLQFAPFYSHYQRFVEQGIPLIFMEEGATIEMLTPKFEKDQVVIFAPASGFERVMYPPGWHYGTAPTMAEQASVVMEYFRENWQEERPPRLVFVGMDAAWGREPLGEATKYAQSLGFEVLPLEIVPFVVLDATTLLLRLKNEGADLVYIQALPMASGPILRDTERLGLLGQMQFAGHSSTMGERVIQMTGVASEGYLTPRAYPYIAEKEIAGIKLMLDNQMKYHGKLTMESEYITGWVPGAVVCEAIKRAIENVGYENVDGPAMKEALDGMKDFDVYGLGRVTYKPDDHRGITKVALYEVKDGKIVRASDWREAPMLVPGDR